MQPGRHIVLIGMMGVGKTTVSRLLADRLGYELWDNDEALAKATGMTAAEVQRLEGQDALHRVEVRLLRAALRRADPTVIAAPGSVALMPGALDPAVTVWLRVGVDQEVANIAHSGQQHRPLAADAATVLRGLAHDRAAEYARLADAIVDVASDPAITCDRVLEALRALPPGRRDRAPRSGA